MAFFNSAQNFTTLKLTRRIYGNVAPEESSESLATYLVAVFTEECSFVISYRIASEDLRGLDSPLGCRAPLRSIQHQSKNVSALFLTRHDCPR